MNKGPTVVNKECESVNVKLEKEKKGEGVLYLTNCRLCKQPF